MRIKSLLIGSQIAVAFLVGIPPAVAELPDPTCIPPVVRTEAECIFDIWGYVYDVDGKPFPGIVVSDGGQSDITDTHGFYNVHAFGFDTYRLTASKHGCSSDVKTVQVTPATVLEENGNRQDFHMPCRIDTP
ncbi:MAG TPA: carboxypeptidase-like regulatory domain-containing protein [Actinomycetota bacterium]